MAGRKPLPTKLKILKGTARKDYLPQEEMEPKRIEGYIPAPEHLSEFSIQEWERVVPELIRLGVMTTIDISSLEMACVNYGVYRECYEEIYYARNPETGYRRHRSIIDYLKSEDGVKRHALNAMNKAFDQYRRFVVEFGLTPSSRGKIDLKDLKPDTQGESLGDMVQ